MNYSFKNIFIEENIIKSRYTDRILDRIDSKSIETFKHIETLKESYFRKFDPTDSSETLILSSTKGEILRKCPGSNGHICCNYFVINLYIGCPINCSYCVLQSYLNRSSIIINVDIDNIFDKLDTVFKDNNNKKFRVGTGELGDSLFYDPLTDFSLDFIDFFSKYSNTIFEFKTKTNFIDNLLKIDSPNNIVVSFSVNPTVVVKNEELNAASIEGRLAAAKTLANHGYKIALHFDPVVLIDNFYNEYENLIKMIFLHISPKDIAWISIGTLRYSKELKNMIEYNHPNSNILYKEFVKSKDEKFRYFKPIRLELYKIILSLLLKFGDENLVVYLCMESIDVWKELNSSFNLLKNSNKALFST